MNPSNQQINHHKWKTNNWYTGFRHIIRIKNASDKEHNGDEDNYYKIDEDGDESSMFGDEDASAGTKNESLIHNEDTSAGTENESQQHQPVHV